MINYPQNFLLRGKGQAGKQVESESLLSYAHSIATIADDERFSIMNDAS
jgi:hypothetical protein